MLNGTSKNFKQAVWTVNKSTLKKFALTGLGMLASIYFIGNSLVGRISTLIGTAVTLRSVLGRNVGTEHVKKLSDANVEKIMEDDEAFANGYECSFNNKTYLSSFLRYRGYTLEWYEGYMRGAIDQEEKLIESK